MNIRGRKKDDGMRNSEQLNRKPHRLTNRSNNYRENEAGISKTEITKKNMDNIIENLSMGATEYSCLQFQSDETLFQIKHCHPF